MFYKVMYILLGSIMVIFGFLRIIHRGYYSSRFDYYFDFGPQHYLLGIIIVFVGILLVLYGLRKSARRFEGDFSICPRCSKPFHQKDVPGKKCPDCDVDLENLEGFYDRHPEAKQARDVNVK